MAFCTEWGAGLAHLSRRSRDELEEIASKALQRKARESGVHATTADLLEGPATAL